MLSDIDLSSTINRCKEKLINTCEEYVSSEFSFGKVIKNKVVQVIVPLVLIFISIVVIKPQWSLTKDTEDINYVKVTFMSASIYILVLFVIMIGKSYFCSPC